MSNSSNGSIRRKFPFEGDHVTKITNSGNSKNEINIFSHSDAISKSAVKVEAEQEQEQDIIIEEEEG
ncbi:hypothetical protein ACNRWW_15970 [Metabacillus sp. HB246100]